MRESYNDICSLINREPTWFDEYGVPRYAPFGPRLCANIYVDEAALVEVACQSCGRLFHVAHSAQRRHGNVAAAIRARELDYGDPPNVGCCLAGATMNSVPHRVIEYWARSSVMVWSRDPALEVEIMADWWREVDHG